MQKLMKKIGGSFTPHQSHHHSGTSSKSGSVIAASMESGLDQQNQSDRSSVKPESYLAESMENPRAPISAPLTPGSLGYSFTSPIDQAVSFDELIEDAMATDEPKYIFRVSGKITEAKHLLFGKQEGTVQFYYEAKYDSETKCMFQSQRATDAKNPFWVEDFKMDTIYGFKGVKFVIWMVNDETDTKSWFIPVGKIYVPRKKLKNVQEDWYALMDASLEDQISGKVLIRIKYLGIKKNEEGNSNHEFLVFIVEGKELGFGAETISPYAVLHVFPDPFGGSGKQTKTLTKTCNPIIKEGFTFQVDAKTELAEVDLHCSFWNSEPGHKSVFLGHCYVPLSTVETKKSFNAWIPLYSVADDAAVKFLIEDCKSRNDTASYGKQLALLLQNGSVSMKYTEAGHEFEGRPSDLEKCFACSLQIIGNGHCCANCSILVHQECKSLIPPSCGSKGAIRMKLNFVKFLALKNESYKNFIAILKAEDYRALRVFGKNSSLREEVARLLLHIFHDSYIDFVKNVIRQEIMETADSKTLFRANSMASKALDVFMKTEGASYLKQVLEDVLKSIVRSKVNFELDPTRTATADVGSSLSADGLAENSTNLTKLIFTVSEAIFASVDKFPKSVQSILSFIVDTVKEKYPSEEAVRYTSVSGFIFLRFFNTAIIAPNSFNLDVGFQNENAKRKFTLIAKTMQNLANLTEFGRKETYMQPINPFIICQIPEMKIFLEKVSSPVDYAILPVPVIATNLSKDCAELCEILSDTMQKLLSLNPTDALLLSLESELKSIEIRGKSIKEVNNDVLDALNGSMDHVDGSESTEKVDKTKFGWVGSSNNFLSRMKSISKTMDPKKKDEKNKKKKNSETEDEDHSLTNGFLKAIGPLKGRRGSASAAIPSSSLSPSKSGSVLENIDDLPERGDSVKKPVSQDGLNPSKAAKVVRAPPPVTLTNSRFAASLNSVRRPSTETSGADSSVRNSESSFQTESTSEIQTSVGLGHHNRINSEDVHRSLMEKLNSVSNPDLMGDDNRIEKSMISPDSDILLTSPAKKIIVSAEKAAKARSRSGSVVAPVLRTSITLSSQPTNEFATKDPNLMAKLQAISNPDLDQQQQEGTKESAAANRSLSNYDQMEDPNTDLPFIN